MNKKQSSMMASMRKKLLAAVAMLLVACIMTVSSTYAWFTLSTAPEVKGISTTIGSNGNLEMALGTYETFTGISQVGSGTDSSFAATGNWLTTNITWGNLVDLSNEAYGLQNITLYPTRLNSTGIINRTGALKFPVYGSDGRVSSLSANTLLGAYDATSQGFIAPAQSANPAYGVSAIGSASSMSPRAFAVMNGKANQKNYQAAAKSAAQDAIRLYGGQLATIALNHQDDAAGTSEVTVDELTALKGLVAELQKSNTAISESLKAAILVVLASAENVEDGAWTAGVKLAEGKDFAEYLAALNETATAVAGLNLTSFSALTDLTTEYTAIKNALSDTSTAITTAEEDGVVTWGEVKDAVSGLLDSEGIKIGGYTVKAVKDDYAAEGLGSDVISDLLKKMNSQSLSITFTAGIFNQIAEMTGSYNSSLSFPEGVEVQGMPLDMFGVMTVEVIATTGASGKLGYVATELLADLDAPAADATAAQPLTDTYGYIIDLLFRTNATDSDLLLQTEAANRYMEGASSETMGNGSNFTFTLNEGKGYDKDKIDGLAAGIRVVFFEADGDILGVAVLDTDNGTVSGEAYKMNLELHEYSFAADGAIEIGAKKADAKLCDLTPNTATGVSALVYLDGDVIDNAAAAVTTELQASVNLQFASSAELVPMENADLKGEASQTPTTSGSTTESTSATEATVTEGN